MLSALEELLDRRDRRLANHAYIAAHADYIIAQAVHTRDEEATSNAQDQGRSHDLY